MFRKTLVLLSLLYMLSDGHASSDPEFRPDYTFIPEKGRYMWLKLHLVPATWSEAKFMCNAEGAYLASPLSPEIRDAIVDHVRKESSVQVIFTGVHSTYAKGVYSADNAGINGAFTLEESSRGVPLSKLAIKWALGEPDNFENSENCLAMLTENGTMKDVKCTDVLPYVCYKTQMGVPVVKTRCGAHDSAYNFTRVTSKCYKFHRHGLTWTYAYKTCMAEGGHLAVVNSGNFGELNFLQKFANETPDSEIFSNHKMFVALGFSDPNDGRSWITIHGDTLQKAGSENWHDGEPNNATQPEGELCGVMRKDTGTFYDVPCSWPLAFICEKDPERLEDDYSAMPDFRDIA